MSTPAPFTGVGGHPRGCRTGGRSWNRRVPGMNPTLVFDDADLDLAVPTLGSRVSFDVDSTGP